MVALTLLVLHRTGSGVAVGLLSACQFGPILLLSAWAGVIVDRTDKRKLLVITQSLEMVPVVRARARWRSCIDAPLGAFYAAAIAGGCMLAFDNPVRRIVRQRDGADRGRPERGDALQRDGQHLAASSGRRIAGRADRDRRLRMVLHDRRGLVPDGADRARA